MSSPITGDDLTEWESWVHLAQGADLETRGDTVVLRLIAALRAAEEVVDAVERGHRQTAILKTEAYRRRVSPLRGA